MTETCAEFLKENSWDKTFAAMSELIDGVIAGPQPSEENAGLGGSEQGLLLAAA